MPGTGGIDTGTVQMSPVQGSSIPISKYPGAVGRASASDIDRAKLPSAPELLQQTVPSALIIGDLQGNQFQTDIQFRGFEASPVNGVAQGLAVYQNGVRINDISSATSSTGTSCLRTRSTTSRLWSEIRSSASTLLAARSLST